jgi:hypothetical protein
MNKREAERQTRQMDTLINLGFTRDESEALRRISMTLQLWHERECGTDNGCIERDETTGKAYWRNSYSGERYPIRDMETGARKRLAAILAARNERESEYPHRHGGGPMTTYIQGDPRGAALYIIRPGDVPEGGDIDAYYSRGICVY